MLTPIFFSFNFIQLRQMSTAAPKLQNNDNRSLQVFQTRMINPIDSSIFVQSPITFLLHAFKNPVFFKKKLTCYLVNITEQFTNFNYIQADLKKRARTSLTTISHDFTIAKAVLTPKLPLQFQFFYKASPNLFIFIADRWALNIISNLLLLIYINF